MTSVASAAAHLEANICSGIGFTHRTEAGNERGAISNEPGLAYKNGALAQAEPPRPYYQAVGNEETVYKAAYRQGLSLVLKGPTGCGKTRFVEAMAHDLDRPLITVACHDDLTTADLVGRYLLKGDETVWVDGR